ncbi:hypothetical protein ZHAS_00009634 [Anopheles sinensis]|uniref:Uncharacterized protein n=1 Tax=Anopheles sinensis TaxID=74873 RepID=A0A084VVQ7_ANOSI|nr:hypothetical protein ZHAS_00009634 [Anopheles sinensis]
MKHEEVDLFADPLIPKCKLNSGVAYTHPRLNDLGAWSACWESNVDDCDKDDEDDVDGLPSDPRTPTAAHVPSRPGGRDASKDTAACRLALASEPDLPLRVHAPRKGGY